MLCDMSTWARLIPPRKCCLLKVAIRRSGAENDPAWLPFLYCVICLPDPMRPSPCEGSLPPDSRNRGWLLLTMDSPNPSEEVLIAATRRSVAGYSSGSGFDPSDPPSRAAPRAWAASLASKVSDSRRAASRRSSTVPPSRQPFVPTARLSHSTDILMITNVARILAGGNLKHLQGVYYLHYVSDIMATEKVE